MQILPLHTDRAPAAVGPYSQAVRVGDFLFASGQIALDPARGELVGPDLEAQTRRVLDNLLAVLQNAGLGLTSVVKVQVYLTEMSDFARLNEIYGEYFAEHKPARTCVEVSRLPKDARVEMDVIAAF